MYCAKQIVDVVEVTGSETSVTGVATQQYVRRLLNIFIIMLIIDHDD